MFFRTLQLWMFLMNYCQYQQPMLTLKYPFAFSFVGGNAYSKTSICIHCTLNSVNSGQLVSSQIQTTQCYPKFNYNRRCYPEFRLFTDSVIKYSYFPCDLNIVTIYSIFYVLFLSGEPEDDANSDSKHHVLVFEKANIKFIGL